MQDERVSVLQVIDSLAFGGAEQMAVNLANLLPRDRFRLHLCTTRKEGPLAEQLFPDVGRLTLNRTTRFREPCAIYEMVKYIRKHEIRILHCHQRSIFLCSLVSLFCKSVAVVWHDHFGPVVRPRWLYRIGTLRANAIISVSEELAIWARKQLGFAADSVFFINNFVVPRRYDGYTKLPTKTGGRIVCTANISPDKDTINLVQAMALVVKSEPDAQALIIGRARYPDYLEIVEKTIIDHNLQNQIFLLGSRNDVDQILPQCDIGVISSASEGLPLALIEYGMAGLATVATRVGQCSDVLGGGRNGILVPPRDSILLAEAIIRLLRSDSERETYGREFKRITSEKYGPDRNIDKIVDIYDFVVRNKPLTGKDKRY